MHPIEIALIRIATIVFELGIGIVGGLLFHELLKWVDEKRGIVDEPLR